MHVFEMVVWIVAITMVAGIIQRKMSLDKAKLEQLKDGNVDDERLKSLEERVVVLERLATDKSVRLRDEIDGL